MKFFIFPLACLLLAQTISTEARNVEHKTFTEDDIAAFTMNPKDFELINNETFYISPIEMLINHKYAKIVCNNNGMKLMSFTTEEKWLMIKNHLETHGHENLLFWSSGKKNEAGVFEWTETGEAFTFTAWEMDQPNEMDAEEVCVNYGPPKLWYDEDCLNLAYFVCEF